jgi:hypothetical protein
VIWVAGIGRNSVDELRLGATYVSNKFSAEEPNWVHLNSHSRIVPKQHRSASRGSADRTLPGEGPGRLSVGLLATTTAESTVSANVGPLVNEAATPLRTGVKILAPFTHR